jgi:uncharacterized ferredoxin-like protein
MRMDGFEVARESVLTVAKLAAAAAYRAPQITGVVSIQTEIITEEDQDPIIEYAGTLAPIFPGMAFDYQTIKYFRENKLPGVCLLLGAKLDRSELAWDCGACGFESCAEFNRYAKENSGPGTLMAGPNCHWKMMDYAAACDYACAAAHQNRIDARAMASIGAACGGVGYLPECSARLAVLMGPPGDFIYYCRRQNRDSFPYEQHRLSLFRSAPTNWQAFPGGTKPSIKTRDDWWSNPEFIKWEPLSEAEMQFVNETMAKLQQVAAKHAPNIQKWYKK